MKTSVFVFFLLCWWFTHFVLCIMWSWVRMNDSCVSLECVNERWSLCILQLSICGCWGVAVVCAVARPTYSIIGEQLDEAKQVVLDSMVKIWVKTGSFTAPCLTLTLLCLWLKCVCLHAGVHIWVENCILISMCSTDVFHKMMYIHTWRTLMCVHKFVHLTVCIITTLIVPLECRSGGSAVIGSLFCFVTSFFINLWFEERMSQLYQSHTTL